MAGTLSLRGENMNVTLEEMKTYLRVDYDDEDALLTGLITTAEELCAHIARLPVQTIRKWLNRRKSMWLVRTNLHLVRSKNDGQVSLQLIGSKRDIGS